MSVSLKSTDSLDRRRTSQMGDIFSDAFSYDRCPKCEKKHEPGWKYCEQIAAELEKKRKRERRKKKVKR